MTGSRRSLITAAVSGSVAAGAAIASAASRAGQGGSEPRAARQAKVEPRRIVSLGACLDAVLLRVAEADRIVALSRYSRDPDTSTVTAEAVAFDVVGETAEEVMRLEPDLILASRRTGLHTRQALTRLGLELSAFPPPETIADSMEQVRTIAELVGRPERGETLVATIEAAMTRHQPASLSALCPTALIYQHDGLCPGAGTLMDELLNRMGFENAAARFGVRRWGRVSLERLVADPPQVLFVSEGRRGAGTLDDRVVSHPALRAVRSHMRLFVFPSRYLYCAGPTLIEASRIMAAARERIGAEVTPESKAVEI